jgi:hypothetical protein
MGFAQSADQLNYAGVPSPRGKSFYADLIHSIYIKWTARHDNPRMRRRVSRRDRKFQAFIKPSAETG